MTDQRVKSRSQQLMLIEMILILTPISLISIACTPFVAMLSFSVPLQFGFIVLGLMFFASAIAIVATWVLCIRFWRDGKAALQNAPRMYGRLSMLGAAVALISIIMAVAGKPSGFLLGLPLLIPFAHLFYEINVQTRSGSSFGL